MQGFLHKQKQWNVKQFSNFKGLCYDIKYCSSCFVASPGSCILILVVTAKHWPATWHQLCFKFHLKSKEVKQGKALWFCSSPSFWAIQLLWFLSAVDIWPLSTSTLSQWQIKNCSMDNNEAFFILTEKLCLWNKKYYRKWTWINLDKCLA